ncbi:MAG TPA: nitroreductase [Paracoccaceae bacterium]|nr:nitroreductase [Paracoccaceae bacterium]
MPQARPEVMDFLLTRRSRPAKTLIAPVPTRDELIPILQAAARTPDHGKLEPWRFIVLEKAALQRIGALAGERAAALNMPDEKITKAANQFDTADLAVAVIAAPVDSEKVPQIEQILSAGAVCLAMVNAALASGWGANWLTGSLAMDRPFVENAFGLKQEEFVAGFIHIGTERAAPPERPRPDLDAITTWVAT